MLGNQLKTAFRKSGPLIASTNILSGMDIQSSPLLLLYTYPIPVLLIPYRCPDVISCPRMVATVLDRPVELPEVDISNGYVIDATHGAIAFGLERVKEKYGVQNNI